MLPVKPTQSVTCLFSHVCTCITYGKIKTDAFIFYPLPPNLAILKQKHISNITSQLCTGSTLKNPSREKLAFLNTRPLASVSQF